MKLIDKTAVANALNHWYQLFVPTANGIAMRSRCIVALSSRATLLATAFTIRTTHDTTANATGNVKSSTKKS